jgi:hypothetical protein
VGSSRLGEALTIVDHARRRALIGAKRAMPQGGGVLNEPSRSRPHSSPAQRWAKRPVTRWGDEAWSYLSGHRAIPEAILALAASQDAIRCGSYGSAWFAHRWKGAPRARPADRRSLVAGHPSQRGRIKRHLPPYRRGMAVRLALIRDPFPRSRRDAPAKAYRNLNLLPRRARRFLWPGNGMSSFASMTHSEIVGGKAAARLPEATDPSRSAPTSSLRSPSVEPTTAAHRRPAG